MRIYTYIIKKSDQFEFPFVFQGFDNDGVIDSTLWLVGNELVSDEKNPSIGIRQGSNHITVIGIDNDGARDSSSFSVYVDAGFIDLGSNLVPTSGLSIFGNNFSFQPDGRGNLSLMTPEESNEFILTAPLQAPVAIASDSSFYLLSALRNLVNIVYLVGGNIKSQYPIGLLQLVGFIQLAR